MRTKIHISNCRGTPILAFKRLDTGRLLNSEAKHGLDPTSTSQRLVSINLDRESQREREGGEGGRDRERERERERDREREKEREGERGREGGRDGERASSR